MPTNPTNERFARGAGIERTQQAGAANDLASKVAVLGGAGDAQSLRTDLYKANAPRGNFRIEEAGWNQETLEELKQRKLLLKIGTENGHKLDTAA